MEDDKNTMLALGRPDNCGLIMEPTYSHFDRIIFPYIHQYWPKELIHKWHIKDHYLEVKLPPSSQIPFYRGKKPHNGGIHKIFFCSATDPNAVRGIPKIAYAHLDEAAMYDEELWDILKYGIGDELAPVLFTTTPKFEIGTIWFKELCDKAKSHAGKNIYDYFLWNLRLSDKEKIGALDAHSEYEAIRKSDRVEDVAQPPIPWTHSYFEISWTSHDNPHLPIEEKYRIEDESIDDEMWYAQEILGQFVEGGKFIFANMPWVFFDAVTGIETENYLTMDPAYKSEQIEDRSQTAINVAGIGPDREIYNYVNDSGYWDIDEQLERLFGYVADFRISKVGIEAVATYDLFERAILEKQRAENVAFEVVPLHHGNKDKVGRAQVVTPFIKNGLITFSRNRGNRELVNQAETFPLGRWTDRVDALAMFFHKDFGVIEGYRIPESKRKSGKPQYCLMTEKEIARSYHSQDEADMWSLVN